MESILSKLEEIGFSRLDASIYMHLLRNNSLTASELSKITGVNRSQIYDILSKLVAKGICTNLRGTVKKYCPVDPKKVLSSLKKELDYKNKLIEEISTSLTEEYNENSDIHSPLEFLHVLNASSSIKAKIDELELNIKEKKCSFNKPPYSLNKRQREYYEFSPDLPKVELINLERGIEYRALYEVQPSNISDFIKKVKNFESVGEKVKISKRLPFKMFIYDTQTVMLAFRNLVNTSPSFTTLVYDHSEYAESMIDIFNLYWEKAMTIDQFITYYNKGKNKTNTS